MDKDVSRPCALQQLPFRCSPDKGNQCQFGMPRFRRLVESLQAVTNNKGVVLILCLSYEA
jgi:hypothetical protein